MKFMRAVGRFMGPLLAFAALSGIGGGMACGALVGLFSLPFIFEDFLYILQSVLFSIAVGFGCGFVAGPISALVGGKIGRWWTFISLSIVAFYLNTFYGADFFVLALPFSALGLLLVKDFLASEVPRFSWDGELRRWLRASWLLKPALMARVVGIFLPIAIGGVGDALLTAPYFLQNRGYTSRFGNWMTWVRSRQIAITQTRHSAKSYSCSSNLKQIMLGVLQYTQDYDEFYPPKPTSPTGGVGSLVQPYLKSTQLFQCPQEFFLYQEGRFESGDFTDYWYNARLYSLSQADRSAIASSIMWGDGNTGRGEANAAHSLGSLPPSFPPTTRHMGGANYAFADGHVKWYKPSSISNIAPPSELKPTLMP